MIRQKHPSAADVLQTVNNCNGPSGLKIHNMSNIVTSLKHARRQKINRFKGHDQLQIIL